MKKVVVLIIFTFISTASFSQGISFEHGTFKEAIEKAKKENKLVFMDCYTTWCGPCKWMSKEIFPQKEVGDFFNDNFISIKVDMEKGEGIALNSKYGIKAYPTLLFIDGNGNEVHKLVGGLKAPDLIEGAKSALNPNLRISSLKAKYDSGNKDPEFLMSYLSALKKQHDSKNMATVAKEIIKQSDLEKFMTKDLFFVISAANYAYNTKAFNYLLKNKKKVKEITEPFEYGTVFYSPIYVHLQEYATKCKSIKELNKEVDRCVKPFGINEFGDIKMSLSYNYYLANNQLQTWYDNKIKDAETLKGDQRYIHNYYNICDEILRSPKLSKSTEIIDNFIKIAVNFAADKENGIIMGNLMLAKLYLHTKEKEKAKNSFNVFFEENAKSGGVNDHPSVTNLKTAIYNL
ncbi:hypothetical protein GCM10022291_14580 [Postechiella marina]|uniref:Thioredoxin domain-containing protein n=1 Tax=Postechiella marina TaxID=943941 RepID=A0ABP8C6R2_9FLAO